MPRRRTRVTVPVVGPTLPAASPEQPARTRGPDSLVTLPQVAMSGSDVDIDLTAGGILKGPPATVKLGNISPYLLEVTLGGQQDVIRPWETNVLPCYGGATMHVHPVVVLPPAPAGTFTLQPAVSTGAATFSGTWPVMNTHIAQALQEGEILGTIITDGTGTSSQSFTLPNGTQDVGYVVEFGSFHNVNTVMIVGDQTGHTWVSNGPISGAPEDFQTAPIAGDTSVTGTVAGTAGQPCKVTFLAFTAVRSVFIRPTFSGAAPLPIPVNGTVNIVSGPTDHSVHLGGFRVALANGASATLLSAVVGEVVYFGWLHLGMALGAGNGGAAVSVQEIGTGASLAESFINFSGATPDDNSPVDLIVDGRGSNQLIVGGAASGSSIQGVKIVNVTGGGVANTYFGSFNCTQQ